MVLPNGPFICLRNTHSIKFGFSKLLEMISEHELSFDRKGLQEAVKLMQ
jgi:hypothetical protein